MRLPRIPPRSLGGRVVDGALAGALASYACIDVIGGHNESAAEIGLTLAALGMTVPLVWRRTHGLAAAAACTAAMTAQSFLAEPPEALWTLIAMVVLAYSVAANEPVRRAGIGALAVSAAISVAIARDSSDSVSNIPPTLLLFVAIPWAAGRTLHGRNRHSDDLTEHVASLQRAQETVARDAVTAERARIAREMHDVVAHSLSVIAIQADAAEAALERDPDLARAPLAAVKNTSREALTEMRRLLGLLRAADPELELEPQPGLGALDALIETVRAAGVDAHVVIEGDRTGLAPGVDLTAYRVVQEGLTNVLKHAGRTRAHVSIRYAPDSLAVEVRNDGAPGQPAGRRSAADSGSAGQGSAGQGLAGMRERVGLYGGVVEAAAGPDGGFRLCATLPR